MEGYEYCYYAEGAVYDLESGQRVQPSDLFYKDVDAAAALSAFVAEKLSEPYNSYGSYYETNGSFVSLADEGWTMTADSIYLFQSYPEVITTGVRFSLDEIGAEVMCTEIPRNMEDAFTGEGRRAHELCPGSELPHFLRLCLRRAFLRRVY